MLVRRPFACTPPPCAVAKHIHCWVSLRLTCFISDDSLPATVPCLRCLDWVAQPLGTSADRAYWPTCWDVSLVALGPSSPCCSAAAPAASCFVRVMPQHLIGLVLLASTRATPPTHPLPPSPLLLCPSSPCAPHCCVLVQAPSGAGSWGPSRPLCTACHSCAHPQQKPRWTCHPPPKHGHSTAASCRGWWQARCQTAGTQPLLLPPLSC